MKMQLHSAMILAGLLAVSTTAFAEETTPQSTETTTKLENVKPNMPDKKPGEADVDEVITNRKLRAETGSKSKYSFSTTLSYLGGTVKQPGADERPNIASVSYVAEEPQLGGSLGAKYKISALQSISADVGVIIYKPFHKDSERTFRDRTTVADPSLSYQVVYKTAGIQNVTSVGASYITDSETRSKVGQTAGFSFSQTAIYDFGGSSWSIGLAGELGYNTYDMDKNTATGKFDKTTGAPILVGSRQSDYQIGLYPFAEVTISEKLNLRTVFRPWTFQHKRSEAFGDIARAPYTQSVGVGISVTRDIFLYPNVQFAPLNMSADRTNVGLQLNLNI